jgi:hypothetical protein
MLFEVAVAAVAAALVAVALAAAAAAIVWFCVIIFVCSCYENSKNIINFLFLLDSNYYIFMRSNNYI